MLVKVTVKYEVTVEKEYDVLGQKDLTRKIDNLLEIGLPDNIDDAIIKLDSVDYEEAV